MIKAPNDRGRSAFQAPNAEDQTLFASSGGHSGGMNGPSPEASASYGHRLRFSIRPAKVGPHSVMPSAKPAAVSNSLAPRDSEQQQQHVKLSLEPTILEDLSILEIFEVTAGGEAR
ncbi:uncharacterized protein TrAFT101_009280 [Trichoderma asperellum]|uniref:uncharacterized protein n=1 Tax=Trichoderma asperellum TaxID=101201 RepID=UPI003325231A|nr:hypothetical protein TrAFT101_009280 [Trichoderma asperellum]